MSKYILKSYEGQPLHALTDDDEHFTLTLTKISFWGLFKSTVKRRVTVPWNYSVKKFTEHWDNLIETGKPIKLS